MTLGAGATQIAPVHPEVKCRQVILQNNAAAAMWLGDSSVTTSNGIYLASGPGGGVFNTGVFSPYPARLSDFFVVGTSGQIVTIFYNT